MKVVIEQYYLLRCNFRTPSCSHTSFRLKKRIRVNNCRKDFIGKSRAIRLASSVENFVHKTGILRRIERLELRKCRGAEFCFSKASGSHDRGVLKVTPNSIIRSRVVSDRNEGNDELNNSENGYALLPETALSSQRLREIIAKQAQLGIPVAQVPDHYMNDGPNHQKGHHKGCHHGRFRQDSLASRKFPNNYSYLKSNKSPPNENGESIGVGLDDAAMKIPRIKNLTSPRSVLNHAGDFKVKQSRKSIETVNPASGIQCPESIPLPPGVHKSDKEVLGSSPTNDITDVDMQLQHNDSKKFHKVQGICRFFQKGFCRKGQRCDHLHVQMSNDSHNQTSLASKHSKREPTLLEKLLSQEIKREKSHLLQIFRFMVNNSFFSEWPNKSIKFFQLSGEASNVNPEQTERHHLSYLSSITRVDEAHTELDEDDTIVVDETESSSHEDIEEGEIVEGEIE